MHLHQLNIENYKCFYDKVSLNFEPGFNILLGANSSGKTAVLDAIDPNGSKYPHRSTLNSTNEGNQGVLIDYSYSLKFEEIQKIFNSSGAIEIAFKQNPELNIEYQISHLLNSQFIRLHSRGFNQSPSHKIFLSSDKVAKIYKYLCSLNSLAPPMVAITLDREGRTQSEIKDIEKKPDSIIKFLPKRMLEDYFLDADAIKFVLREIATKDIDFNEVSSALTQAQSNSSNQQKVKHSKGTYTHSAKVLKEVFWELAQTEYNKIKHGTLIAQYLLKHKPKTLYELRDWFDKFIHLP